MSIRARPWVLFAGGHTGGHLLPGLAVAEALQTGMAGGVGCRFLDTGHAIQRALLPSWVEIAQPRGLSSPLAAPNETGPGASESERPRGCEATWAPPMRPKGGACPPEFLMNGGWARRAWTILRWLGQTRPDAVVALGGRQSVAPALAARLLGIPLFALEQNAVCGRATRLIAPLAQAVCLPWGVSKKSLWLARRAVETGTPVRDAITHLGGRTRLALPTVLVLGGSQGCEALNRFAPTALAPAAGRLYAIHVAGPGRETAVREAYRAAGLLAEVHGLVRSPATLYARADLVLARAGGSTLAEIAIAGLPSVLVPLPGAPGDHQTRNAEVFAQAGAARLLAQAQLGPASARAILELVADRAQLLRMGLAALRLARPAAAEQVAALIRPHLVHPPVTHRRRQAAPEGFPAQGPAGAPLPAGEAQEIVPNERSSSHGA